jgi:hypothetical protein
MSMHKVFVLTERSEVDGFYNELMRLWLNSANSGKPIEVLVRDVHRSRSPQANRYYWKLLRDISDQAWVDGKQYSAEAYHEWAKRQFIGMEELPGGGMIGLSTTTLSVADFADYITKIEAYAAEELGVRFDGKL